ncbi:MAG TPA: alpha/beta hydrolase [Dongiaceae bacterium]|nr:alpha/beta hydrolase [Dongiaceae bacterium]
MVRVFFDTVLHRWLRIPYTLNVRVFQNPKKPKATYVFIHGIGNTLHSWDEVVHNLPHDVRLIGIDLLGFGQSPKPSWAVYNAKTQARSVAVTLLRIPFIQQPVLVGHSLGALVAVEVAKRYPLFVKRLVLCSPPFYNPEVQKPEWKAPERWLRAFYRTVKKHPERLEQLSPLAVKAGLANKALNVTKDNVAAYMAALESSIINQTALQDIYQLTLPIMIFYGTFDPVVVARHIVSLANERPNIAVKRLAVGHEVTGSYAKVVAQYLRADEVLSLSAEGSR